VNVGSGVPVGTGVGVGAAIPGITQAMISRIEIVRAKIGNRFMVNPLLVSMCS